MDYRTWGPRGLYAVRISGRISHSLGALQPNPGASRKFCQIYMLDDADAVEQRAQHYTMITRRDIADGLDREILHVLEAFIRGHHEIAMMFVGAGQRFRDSPNSSAINIMQIKGGPDPIRYNMPTDRHTIAAVFLEEDAVPDGRDFWVHRLGSDMPEQVSELDERFLAMHFPLIHKHGQGGWHPDIFLTARPHGDSAYDRRGAQPHNPAVRPGPRESVSQMEWMAYHLYDRVQFPSRDPTFSILLHSGKLFQEYIVDYYVQVETDRLRYIALNQSKLRVENYKSVRESRDAGLTAADIGKPYILPSTFIGAPWNMTQLYQDAMGETARFDKRPQVRSDVRRCHRACSHHRVSEARVASCVYPADNSRSISPTHSGGRGSCGVSRNP
jgi:hypothetical protein